MFRGEVAGCPTSWHVQLEPRGVGTENRNREKFFVPPASVPYIAAVHSWNCLTAQHWLVQDVQHRVICVGLQPGVCWGSC